MLLSGMKRLVKYFVSAPENVPTPPVVEPVQEVPAAPVKEKTEFEKVLADFKFPTDMIAISYDKLNELNYGERQWLDSLGDRVYYFPGSMLVNIAIIRTM